MQQQGRNPPQNQNQNQHQNQNESTSSIAENRITELERENFDLKMRLYYLNNEKNSDHPIQQLEHETDHVINLLTQRDVTYEQLKLANQEAYSRINELTSELLLLKTKQDQNNNSYENLLLKNQRLGSLQLEENLKRERQASQAIAKHDSILITNYEKEIERLKDTHHADTLLISECSERVGELMKIVEEKNKELERQHQSLIAAQQHVEVLTDRISKQEILLIKNEQSLKSNAIASLSRALNPHQLSPPTLPPHSSSIPTSSSTSSSLPFHPSTSQQSDRTANPTGYGYSYGSGSSYGNPIQDNNSSYRANYNPNNTNSQREIQEPQINSFQPAPRLGTPHFVDEGIDPPSQFHYSQSTPPPPPPPLPPSSSFSHNRSNTPTSQFIQSTRSDPTLQQFHSINIHHNLPPVNNHHINESFPLRKDQLPKHIPNHSQTNENHHRSTSTTTTTSKLRASSSSPTHPSHQPRDKDHPSLSSPPGVGSSQDDEIFSTNKLKSVLYREVESSKLQIKSLTEENEMLKDTLEKNKMFIENQEKTLERVRASAEEITLLEAEEIARLEVELERMKDERDKWMNLSNRHETQLELLKQELYQREKNDDGKFQDSGGTISRENNNFGGGPHNHGHNQSPNNSNSPIFKYRLSSSFTPSNSSRSNSGNLSKNRFSKSAPSSSAASQPESPVIEMYRQREVELLEALEGVVKRCHELEAQVIRSKS